MSYTLTESCVPALLEGPGLVVDIEMSSLTELFFCLSRKPKSLIYRSQILPFCCLLKYSFIYFHLFYFSQGEWSMALYSCGIAL